jgi:hypothetical protein
MRSPCATSAGPAATGAWISLGGDRSKSLVADTGTSFNDSCTRNVAALDREADQLLFLGRHAAAERLADQAAALRQAVAR